MCKAIGYIIAAGLVASPLRGQDVAQMQRRLDSIYAEATRAQQAVLEYRRAHPPRFDFSDSAVLAAGKIKVYFDTVFAKQVRAGLSVAEPHINELGSALDRINPLVFSVVPDSLFNPYDQRYKRLQELNIRQHFGSEPKPAHTSVDGDPESIAYVILRSVSNAVTSKTPSYIGSWTSGSIPLAPDLDAKTDWASIRLTMVSSPSHLGRSCYEGEIRACRVFLGLDTVLRNPWKRLEAARGVTGRNTDETRRAGRIVDSIAIHSFFDATGRQRRVQYDIDRARGFARIATDRCLGGNDEACVSVLYGMGGVSVLSSPFIRNSVVTHAIRLGGPRAVERLVMTEGSYGDALAAAAKMPLDSLIADWQGHLNERATTGNVPLTIAISSLVWVALCVFLALRSSRWR